MATKAQLRANSTYRKKNTKTIGVQFFPADMELYEWVVEQGPKATYIKRLIREDMERNKK